MVSRFRYVPLVCALVVFMMLFEPWFPWWLWCSIAVLTGYVWVSLGGDEYPDDPRGDPCDCDCDRCQSDSQK